MKTACFVGLATLVASTILTTVLSAQQQPGGLPLMPISNVNSSEGSGGVVTLAPIVGAPPLVAPAAYMAPGPQAMPVSWGGGACDACVDPSCDGCGEECCPPRWAAFGEFLYLRPRDVEVAYAVPVDGALAGVQVGPVAVADPDFQPGFRVGFSYIIDAYSSITAQYTMFEAGTTENTAAAPPNELLSLIHHPGVANAGITFLAGTAQYDLSNDIIDVDYRSVWVSCDDYVINYLTGFRYVQHEQNFRADLAGNGTETVITDVDFYGAGAHFGLEMERWIRPQLSVYGKLHGSLIAGEYRTDFRQNQSYDPVVVNTTWKAGRIVPILELETGVAWTSRCDTWRLSAGYLYQGWFNSVQTDEWIKAVQTNNFVGLSDTMTFDGLVARIEARY